MPTTRRFTPLAMLLAASSLMGQETTGTLTGRVTSTSGAALPGAVVRLSSPALLGERTATTDSKGGYRIPLLPSGDFTVSISLKDFATSKGAFHIVAGQTSRQDGVLTPMSEVAKVQAAVVVVESAMSQRDKTETVTQSIYSTEELMKTTATDIFAAAWLSPGVDSNQWGISAPSIRGGSNVGTKILLNGAQVNDGGFSNWNFDPTIPDMVESMAVIQSPINAKYGGTDSGIISWVTTRGSNEFSGTLRRSYYRDFWNGSAGYNMNNGNTTNQPNRLGKVNAPYQAPEGDARGQWQATLRGPLWKDHITFAYATKITPASYSPQTFQFKTGSPYDTVYTAFNNPANGQLITQAYIGDFEGKVMPSAEKASWNQYVLFAQLNENHQLDFSYTQDDWSSTSYRSYTAGGTGLDKTFNSALSVGYKGILSNTGVLDARYGFTKRKWSYPSSNDPAINSMTGMLYPGSNGWRYAANLLELWENSTPYYPVSGSPTDPGDGQADTTADLNYQHILQTATGSHIIDVGGTYHLFEWDTPSPTGRAKEQFQNAGQIDKAYADPNLAGKFIVFPWNATVADVAPGYWSDAAAASQALIYNTSDYYNLLPTLWQGEGQAHGNYNVKTTSFYINDLWTINNQHSVMVGLRNDMVRGADATHVVISYSQITPRIEYKYDLAGDQKRVFNVSMAEFHQPLNGGILQPFIQNRYAYQTTRYWTGTANPSPNAANPRAPYLVDQAAFTNPLNYGFVANYTAPGVDRIDSHVKGMTNDEFTVGYRRNFDNGGFLRITYINRNWKNLYDWFPDAQGTKFTDPFDPTASMWGLSRTLRLDPNAHRRYKAMETEWNLPLAKRLVFGGNYSYARFTGNDNTNLTSTPYRGIKGQPNNSNWNADYYDQYYQQAGLVAAPDQLRRPVHHLKGWFTFDLGSGKVKQALALRFNYDSGYPFSPTEAYSLPNHTVPNYTGSRLPNAIMNLPVAGYNQFTAQGSTGFNLHYTLDVPVYRDIVWFFVADVGNVFQHVVTNDFTPGNYNGAAPAWNAGSAPYPYVHGWRTQFDTSPAASKSGFRTMSLETGIRF